MTKDNDLVGSRAEARTPSREAESLCAPSDEALATKLERYASEALGGYKQHPETIARALAQAAARIREISGIR